MKLYPEHKTSLKYSAAIYLIFGLILLLCGTLFENGNSDIAKHQETMYRQDQVHYWAGIPFVFLGIISVLFLVFQFAFLLKLSICLDFICVNIAVFVVIVEGPDWKKYAAKSQYYSSSGDIDYLMLKPQQAYGMHGPLNQSSYTSAMNYSGTWVVVAILSMLLGIETFLTRLKVYCGIESIFGYLTGYELIYPEIVLKTAKPVEKFQCKGCQTRLLTPSQEPVPTTSLVKEQKKDVRSPPTTVEVPSQRAATDDVPKRSVSPALSDVSNSSNAFYVCLDGDGIKLVGYKPHRHGNHKPPLCTHHEEEEGPSEHYHFSRKHPSEMNPASTSAPVMHSQLPASPPGNPLPLAKDPRSYPSFLSPTRPPLIQHPIALSSIPPPPPPPLPRNAPPSGHSSPSFPSPPRLPPLDFDSNVLGKNRKRNLPSGIHKPTALPPVSPKSPAEINISPVDRSPGKYPPVEDLFPLPPSTLSAPGREKGRVSFMETENASQSSSSRQNRNSKLQTLF